MSFGSPRVAAFHLGPHRVEIDEPGPKQRPRHRLQRRVHPTIQLDLVVQRAEDVRNAALGRHRREGQRLRAERLAAQRRIRRAVLEVVQANELQQIVGEPEIDILPKGRESISSVDDPVGSI